MRAQKMKEVKWRSKECLDDARSEWSFFNYWIERISRA